VSIEQIESSTEERSASKKGGSFTSKNTFRDCKSGAPLVSQNVKTDTAIRVDVGVVDTSREVDLGWLEWIIGREVDGQEEDASRVWRVTLSKRKVSIRSNHLSHKCDQ
jgi:uncharacterized protein (DUF4415 family)